MKKIYLAIDLKSFYASVECVERNLDPLLTNLVVADTSRTTKTICLAVSPSLKKYRIPGRIRLFELIKKVKEINYLRKKANNYQEFTNYSINAQEIESNKSCGIDYIAATPRMALYIEYSKKIYQIYLKYVASEDIHVYSIDEVFMDITNYLSALKMKPQQFAEMIIKDVLKQTGITATAGIGTNLYLAKVAMDIVAKHQKADQHGVRIACLNEQMYKELLWDHQPITDFWRIGQGYEKKLAKLKLYTMGDIARCSLGQGHEYYNEELLYKTFGINAELLIDHAWGYESCTIAAIKQYQPKASSISSGQVLDRPYQFAEARILAKEMADVLMLDLVKKKLMTNHLVLTVSYDRSNPIAENDELMSKDYYGHQIIKHAQGCVNLTKFCSSSSIAMKAIDELFAKIVNPNLTIRRLNLAANVQTEKKISEQKVVEQLDLFNDFSQKEENKKNVAELLEKEKKLQEATLRIKGKYGKNSILKGLNFQEGAKTRERNKNIGGHKA